jgi:Ca2+-binding RTX toxin-like protein
MGTSAKSIVAAVAGVGAMLVWSSPPVGATNSVITVDSAGDIDSFTSLALDAAGNPVISYYDGAAGDLRLAHCDDPNCSGGGESLVTVDSGGNVGHYPSLALDGAGNPVVSYYDVTNGDLKLAHCDDANCAGGGEFIATVDGTANVGEFSSLELDAVGRPVISYFDASAADLRLAHCNDANCAGGGENIVTVDNGPFVGAYGSLELDAAGNPVISYHDSTNGDLKVVHCDDANCSAGGDSMVAVDTRDTAGLFTSLVLDAAGSPVISYFHSTNGDLKVAHCNDPNCSGADESIGTVDAVGKVGLFSSVALDAAGNPVVSYHDNSNGHLKVVHCDDVACAAGGDTFVTVDSRTGNLGWYTSLALDAAGNPVISYLELLNKDLKLAHCETATCAPPTCAGAAATIVGTAGDDVIDGTPGVDVIAGGDGDDTINGLDGNDLICGGAGDDQVDGGAGDDRVSGDRGLDTLAGGDGDDQLDGSLDDDFLTGGAGDDELVGAAGNDELVGDDGVDTADYSASPAGMSVDLMTHLATGDGLDGLSAIENLVGTNFDDALAGDAGDNSIDGGAGSDLLLGGEGNDRLDGGNGADRMFGHEDDDVVVGGDDHDFMSGGDGHDLLAGLAGGDGMFGDAGVDTATFATAPASVTADLTAGTATGDGPDGLEQVENLIGSNFDDVLTGNDGGNNIDGGPGDDSLAGLAGDDVVVGSAGNDTVFGGRDNDVLVGAAGDDVIDGGDGSDFVSFATSAAAVTVDLPALTATGDGTDVVRSVRAVVGSSFDDVLTGDVGNNSIDGGGGNDVIAGLAGDDALTGGAGVDTVTYIASSLGVSASLRMGRASGDGNDDLAGFENLVGSAFDDVVSGDAGANAMDGGGGVDTVSYAASPGPVAASLTGGTAVGDGADRLSGFENLVGSRFADTLTGDTGRNSIEGGNGNDSLTGRGGNDTLDGAAGVDTVSFAAASKPVTASLTAGTAAGDGSDLLVGFENLAGSKFGDVLTGDAGRNALSGGGGNDLVAGAAGNDLLDGGAGVDTVSFAAASKPVTASLTAGTAAGEGSDQLSRLENLIGSRFADRLTGNAHPNALWGGVGDDRITALAGNDTLNGGADFDRADGGAGVDTQRQCEMTAHIP